MDNVLFIGVHYDDAICNSEYQLTLKKDNPYTEVVLLFLKNILIEKNKHK